MILVTHGIIGGGLGAVLPGGPAVSFVVGFASHFILDALPHWDYKLGSVSEQFDDEVGFKVKNSPALLVDVTKVSIDGLAGLFLPLLFFPVVYGGDLWLSIFLGALGAILPDFLQFIYAKKEYRFMKPLQAFHEWIHTDQRIKDPLIGFSLQVIPILFFVSILVL